MSSEKFCLRWNDFETNISLAFRELREEKDFFDVTLACDDSQVQAHKVILSACSPFFRNVLRRNPHQHPLLYLKGVKYKELLSVLNFMYMGEVNVAQEELNSFLSVAEDLRVKGLTQNNSSARAPSPKITPNKPEPPKQVVRSRDLLDRDSSVPSKRPRPTAPVVQQSYQREDDEIQEMVPVKSEPRDPVVISQHTVDAPQSQSVYQANDSSQATAVALEENYAAEESYDYGYEGYDDGSGLVDPNTGMPYADNGADKGKPVEVKINIKKDLLKKIGNAKQCKLCNKLFSSEFKAVDHIHEVHNDYTKISSVVAKDTKKEPIGWQCKFCGLKFKTKKETEPHLKEIHGIVTTTARERSIKKIQPSCI